MLNYTDITEELCTRCGACCQVYIPVAGNDRYIEYIKQIGLSYIQDGPNTLQLMLGPCPKLKVVDEAGERKYYCSIYEKRPKLCQDYNCVAWAAVGDNYDTSPYLRRAEQVFCKLKARKESAGE